MQMPFGPLQNFFITNQWIVLSEQFLKKIFGIPLDPIG